LRATIGEVAASNGFSVEADAAAGFAGATGAGFGRRRWCGLRLLRGRGRAVLRFVLGFVAFAFDLEDHDRRAHRGHRAGFAVKREHFAGDGRGHFDRRFVRHHVDEVLVFVDRVADGDVPGDDLGLCGAFADVG